MIQGMPRSRSSVPPSSTAIKFFTDTAARGFLEGGRSESYRAKHGGPTARAREDHRCFPPHQNQIEWPARDSAEPVADDARECGERRSACAGEVKVKSAWVVDRLGLHHRGYGALHGDREDCSESEPRGAGQLRFLSLLRSRARRSTTPDLDGECARRREHNENVGSIPTSPSLKIEHHARGAGLTSCTAPARGGMCCYGSSPAARGGGNETLGGQKNTWLRAEEKGV